MTLFTEIWGQFGLIGLIVGALFALILYVMRDHRQERRTWLSSIISTNEKMVISIDRLTDEMRWSRQAPIHLSAPQAIANTTDASNHTSLAK